MLPPEVVPVSEESTTPESEPTPEAPAPPAPPEAEEPPSAPALPEIDATAPRLDRLIGMFNALDKLMRGTRLYEGRGSLVQRLMEELLRRTEAALTDGDFTVRVTPFGLLYGEEQVSQGDTRLTEFLFRFFCDGIRELTFSPGLEADELRSFVDVLISDPRQGEEDYATLLWKRELPHIHFYATDTLQTGINIDDEEDQGLLAAAEQSRLQSQAGSMAKEVVLSPDDLRMLKTEDGLGWVTECAAPMRVGEVAEGTLKSVQDAFDSPWDHGRFLQMAVRASEDRPDEPSPLVIGMFDSLVASGEAKGAARLLSASGEAARMGGYAAKNLRAALFDPERIAGLERLYARHTDLFQDPIQEAAREHPDALIALLNKLEPGETRDGLRIALLDAGIDLTPFYRRCLDDPNEAVVLDAIGALAKEASEASIEALTGALGYTSTKVRRAALKAIVGNYPEQARVSLARALGDPDRECRMLALTVLGDSGDRRVAGNILSRIQDSLFSTRDAEEQTAFLKSLAAFKDPRTVPFFSTMLNEMKIARGGALQDRQILAVEALGAIATEDARAALTKCSRKWSAPRNIKQAAKQALTRMERS
jgi:hypothetical protein